MSDYRININFDTKQVIHISQDNKPIVLSEQINTPEKSNLLTQKDLEMAVYNIGGKICTSSTNSFEEEFVFPESIENVNSVANAMPIFSRKSKMVFADDNYLLIPKSESLIRASSKFRGKGHFRSYVSYLENKNIFVEDQEVNGLLNNVINFYKYVKKGDLVGMIQDIEIISQCTFVNAVTCESEVALVDVNKLKEQNMNLRNPFRDIGGKVVDINGKLLTREKKEIWNLLNRYINVLMCSQRTNTIS